MQLENTSPTNVRTNRLTAGSLGFAVALLSLLTTAATGQNPADGNTATALTIYSSAKPGAIPPEVYLSGTDHGRWRNQLPGYAVIKQERPFTLEPGRSTVRFTDVASEIDPTTVSFLSLTDPETTHVLEQNFEFDLVSAAKLLQRYVDHPVNIGQKVGDKIEIYEGTLLSVDRGVVMKRNDGRITVLNNYDTVSVTDLPGGLITRPTLVWDIFTKKPGKHRTRVSYQTAGITWWADYNVTFAEGDNANAGVLDLGAWVSIINQSGATYPDAKLKLIAGDVHRAETARPKLARARELAFADQIGAAPPGFEEKSFFEYHLYTLGRPTTLPDNSTKQLELFPAARGVPCEKVLVYYGLNQRFRGVFPNPRIDRNYGLDSNKKVDIYLRFRNAEEIGLGIPLPAGRIRVSKLDPADDSLEFIGEDVIDHTPKNEELLIKLGSAFDVVGERRQVDFKVDQRRDWMDETIEVKLRNHKDEPVKVIVKENLYRWVNWEIRDASHDYDKTDARTIEFPVTLKPDEEAAVTYTVHYAW